MITRKHLYIFKTVATTQSMSKAAQLLYISQPTISQKIQEIENQYDIKLFERYSKKLFITEEGKTLLNLTNSILGLYDDMDHIFSKDNRFSLKIGATLTVGNTIISPLLKQLKEQYPSINIEVCIDNTHIIEEKILNNYLDIVLIEGELTHPDFIVTPVIHDKLVFACAYDFPIPDTLEIQELTRYPFINREEGSGTREQLEEYIKKHHIHLKSSWECHSWEAVKQAILYNHGIALVPLQLIENEVYNGDLKIIPIDSISLERDFCICYHKNKKVTKKLSAFIETCQIYGQELKNGYIQNQDSIPNK